MPACVAHQSAQGQTEVRVQARRAAAVEREASASAHLAKLAAALDRAQPAR